MAKVRHQSIYEFDGFRLDEAKLMLYSGAKELQLAPKVVETLLVLVRERGAIVSKSDLIDAVWVDSIVEESNLTQYLYLLRKTLGKRPDGTSYIETLRRRGYRFTAEVRSPVGAGSNLGIPPRAEHRPVECRGNVLALVDWKDPESATAEVQPARAPSAPPQREIRTRAWALAISICLLAAVSAAFYIGRSGASDRDGTAFEQNVLRLTNGIEVVDATISPDGDYFVYHEPDGKLYRMWLQQTGHATRHEIVPASGRIPLSKTFTPDGQFIYFLATDNLEDPASLYRVATLGGPVTKILTGVGSGVSFSPDGREMVFARIEGGEVKHVVRASDGRGTERLLYRSTGFPNSAWSPDGRSIAIQLEAKRPGIASGCTLAVVDKDTGKLSRFSDELWSTCSRMEWAPNSRGLYMIGTRANEDLVPVRDQVFYIPYPHGKSRKLTDEGSRFQLASLGVSKDGSVLAVPYNRASQISVMDPNGDSRSAIQITNGLSDGRAGIGPLADGRVAYVARTGKELNIWVMNQDGSDQKQITESPNWVEELRSGGDGRYLVFSSITEDKRSHLFRIGTDGTGLEKITSGEGQEIDSSMSRDGKWITYDSAVYHGSRCELTLWRQSIDTGERTSLNRTDCQMPHFSPDDKYISCVRDQKDILILSSADGALVSTIRVPQSSTLQHTLNFGARWAPDGKAVVYTVNDNGVSNLWTHPIDGSSPKPLTNFTNGNIYHFAYSLDGSRLFLARGNQIKDAILLREKR